MKVKAKKPIQHEGRTHQTGDVFDVPDTKGKQLIDQGHAEEHKPVGGMPEKSSEPAPKIQGGTSTATAEPEAEPEDK